MGFFDSIFAKPGSSSAQGQNRRQAGAANLGSDLLKELRPGLIEQARFTSEMTPGYHDWLRRGILQSQPGNTAGMVARDQNAAFDTARKGARLAGAMNPGASDGYTGGNIEAHANAGTDQANQIYSYYHSPEYQQMMQQILGQYIQQGYQLPGMPAAAFGANLVYGQPQVQQGAGFLDYLGGAAGQAAGSYAGRR